MVDRDVAADVRLGRKEQRDNASCKSSPRRQRLQEIASLTYRDGGAWTSSLSREGALF
jgi:hypothetical protein